MKYMVSLFDHASSKERVYSASTIDDLVRIVNDDGRGPIDQMRGNKKGPKIPDLHTLEAEDRKLLIKKVNQLTHSQ